MVGTSLPRSTAGRISHPRQKHFHGPKVGGLGICANSHEGGSVWTTCGDPDGLLAFRGRGLPGGGCASATEPSLALGRYSVRPTEMPPHGAMSLGSLMRNS